MTVKEFNEALENIAQYAGSNNDKNDCYFIESLMDDVVDRVSEEGITDDEINKEENK